MITCGQFKIDFFKSNVPIYGLGQDRIGAINGFNLGSTTKENNIDVAINANRVFISTIPKGKRVQSAHPTTYCSITPRLYRHIASLGITGCSRITHAFSIVNWYLTLIR